MELIGVIVAVADLFGMNQRKQAKQPKSTRKNKSYLIIRAFRFFDFFTLGGLTRSISRTIRGK